jgi:hypothetical protein
VLLPVLMLLPVLVLLPVVYPLGLLRLAPAQVLGLRLVLACYFSFC